jgi:hypothetical protein
MTDDTIDDLLDELVPGVEPLPDWAGVLRRARRSRRRHVAAAIVVSAFVVVPTAVAVGGNILDWFHGKPAPPAVKQQFVKFDAQAQALAAFAAKNGFHRKAPLAIASKAHGVMALEVSGAKIYLWAAPERGGGACSLLQVLLAAGGSLYSSDCDPQAPLRRTFRYSTMGAQALRAGNLLTGRAIGASSVVVHLSNRSTLTLPVVEGFFVGVVPRRTHPIELDSMAGSKRLALLTFPGGTTQVDASERARLTRVSAAGSPLRLPPGNSRTAKLVARGYLPIVRVLAVRDGRRYLRLASAHGKPCYAIGPVAAAWPVATRLCGTAAAAYAGALYFPSYLAPILDFSTRGPTASGTNSHLVRVGGIAADDITRVVVKDREGRGLVWLPVKDNVYDSGATPLPDAAVQLAAEDAHGRVLATVPR